MTPGRGFLWCLPGVVLASLAGGHLCTAAAGRDVSLCSEQYSTRIELPAPSPTGGVTVEDALRARESVREYGAGGLTLKDLSALLWAAQGQTRAWGGRTAPSAGGTFPIEIRAVVADVEGIGPGVYRYRPDSHQLLKIRDGVRREDMGRAALGQRCLETAPVVLAVSAVYERTKTKYGDRGVRYAHIEVGAVCQNVYLEAESLGLDTVLVGAFYDDRISDFLDLDRNETPLALMPVGRPASP